jgi:hypothetical protein
MQVLEVAPVIAPSTIKSFGAFGPKYEVLNPLYSLENGDWLFAVKLVETGEEVTYSYADIQNDPEAV